MNQGNVSVSRSIKGFGRKRTLMRNTCAYVITSNPIDSAKRFFFSLFLRRPLSLPPSYLSIYLFIYLTLFLFLSYCHVLFFLFFSFTPPLAAFPFSPFLFPIFPSLSLSLCFCLSLSLVYALLYHLTSLSDYYTVRKGISSSLKTRSVSVRVTRPVDSYGTRKYARPFLVCILVSLSSFSFRFSSHVLSSYRRSRFLFPRIFDCLCAPADWIYAS